MKLAILVFIGAVSAMRVTREIGSESAAVPIDEYTFSERDHTNEEIKEAWSEMDNRQAVAERKVLAEKETEEKAKEVIME